MSGPDWYRWYPAKWASGVILLTPEQRGVYMDIINVIFDRGACPEDYAYLSRVCNCRVPRVRRIVGELVQRGKLTIVSGTIRQERAHTERTNSEQFSELQRNRGRNRSAKSNKNNDMAATISLPETLTPRKRCVRCNTNPTRSDRANVCSVCVRRKPRQRSYKKGVDEQKLKRAWSDALIGTIRADYATMPYKDYLASGRWEEKRKTALKAADYRCQVCYSNGETLDVHHRTYERRGDERPTDLTVLCRTCHELFHRRDDAAK